MTDNLGRRALGASVSEPGFRDAAAQARLDAEGAKTVGDYGRRLAGISLTQVAKRTGFSVPRCEALLNGYAVPQAGELEKIGKAVHCPADQLHDAATPEAKARYRGRF